jgi:transcriptional regulator with XRE-family HTH domain
VWYEFNHTINKEAGMSFGETIKKLRLARKQTLRQFCVEFGHDPSNWSKIERGVNPPPKDEATLIRWAADLSVKAGTPEWNEFMDQAAISRGQIPKDLMSDASLVQKLPVLFRTVRGAELTDEKLDDLIETIRKVHSPDED